MYFLLLERNFCSKHGFEPSLMNSGYRGNNASLDQNMAVFVDTSRYATSVLKRKGG